MRTTEDLQTKLAEMQADAAALAEDVATLNGRADELAEAVVSARRARDFARAADLEQRRVAVVSVAQATSDDLAQLGGEIAQLEHELGRRAKVQRLVVLAQEAHGRGEAFKAELHKARDGLVKALLDATDADRQLIETQHAFRQGLSALLGNGALSAASATDAQRAAMSQLLEQVERDAAVPLDAAVQDRRGNVQAFWRRDLDFGDLRPFDAPKFGELLRLTNEYQEHLELEAGRQPEPPSTPLAPGQGVSLAPVGNQERATPSTHVYPNSARTES